MKAKEQRVVAVASDQSNGMLMTNELNHILREGWRVISMIATRDSVLVLLEKEE